MTSQNDLPAQPSFYANLGKRMLQGAAFALIVIAAFLWSVNEPDPNWSKFWMVKPLIIVPIAGAAGGCFIFLVNHLLYRGAWRKALAVLLSIAGYMVALWLGTVLGLNGTLWD